MLGGTKWQNDSVLEGQLVACAFAVLRLLLAVSAGDTLHQMSERL